MKAFAFMVLAATLLQAAQSAADPKTPLIDRREKRQEQRIQDGEKSGALTDKESAKLNADEKKIDADKAAAKEDGVVTGHERRKLRREERRTSREIAREKHDSEKK